MNAPMPGPPRDSRREAAVDAFIAALRAMRPWLRDCAEAADEAGAVADSTWTVLARCGLLVAPLAVEQGGLGLAAAGEVDALCEALRLLGTADLVLARLFEGHVNAVALVRHYGTAAQSDELADAVRDGALAAVWGADDASPLRLVEDRGGLRLAGRKVLASGAGRVMRPLVTAATAAGPVIVLLRLPMGERADLSGWTAQGMRASATGAVDLDGLMVTPAQIVGAPGDFLRQPHLSGGAWRFCAAHLGAAERLLDLLRADLKARGRDQDPYQVQRVAESAAAVTAAGLVVRSAAHRLAAAAPGGDAAAVVALANIARMVTERAALDGLEAAQRGVGLAAFLRPRELERLMRDLATYLRQPVPDLAMADAGRFVLSSNREIGDLWRER